MENGWRLGGDSVQGIILEKNGLRMSFDIRVERQRSFVGRLHAAQGLRINCVGTGCHNN
jgi:hypothetical protein